MDITATFGQRAAVWVAMATTLVSAVLLALNAQGEEPANPRADRPILAALPVIEDGETFLERSTAGPVVPGLHSRIVPQGLTYLQQSGTYVVSAYVARERKKELASCLIFMPAKGDAPHKTLWLMRPDGTPYKGHVGGVASDGKRLWIATDTSCYSVDLAVAQAGADAGEVTMVHQLDRKDNASFCAVDAGVLWVGEFDVRAGARVVGYRLTGDGSIATSADGAPVIVGSMSLPEESQGMCFIRGYLVVSASYGGGNSVLHVYQDPRPNMTSANEPAVSVDLADYRRAELKAPPMSEGIADTPGGLAVVFENAAKIYIGSKRTPYVDHIRLLPLK